MKYIEPVDPTVDEPTSKPSSNDTSEDRIAEENVANAPPLPNNSKPAIPDAKNNMIAQSADQSRNFVENSGRSVMEGDAQIVIRNLKTDDL